MDYTCSKFSNKLNTIFSDKNIISYIDEKERKRITIDTSTKKIKFIKSKVNSIKLIKS